MGIFSDIVSKIFPAHHPAVAAAANDASSTSATSASGESVDVNSILTKMAEGHTEKLNWQTSIVDLMKLLGLDSSLTARKELAKELHFDGDMNDSAKMNIWLAKQVMAKLSANGGKVPADLLH